MRIAAVFGFGGCENDGGECLGYKPFFAPGLDKIQADDLMTAAGPSSLDLAPVKYHLKPSGL